MQRSQNSQKSKIVLPGFGGIKNAIGKVFKR